MEMMSESNFFSKEQHMRT